MMALRPALRWLGVASVATSVLVSASGCAATSADDASDEATAESEEAELRESLRGRTPTALDTFDRRAQWIDTYGAMSASCIDKVDQLDGRRAIFHGCYDWHSSVHAHWALYRMDLDGTGRKRSLAERADARLGDDAIRAVAEELRTEPEYEMPYGRAWLLRLVSEHEEWHRERHGQPSLRLRALGDQTAASLLASFEASPPDPRIGDYRNGSWPIAQLVAYARHTKDRALSAKVVDLVESRFAARPVTWAETTDEDPSAFFSSWWSWVYVISSTFDSDRTLSLVTPESIPDEALTPIADPGVADDVHHLGINWSRSWAIKAFARHAIAKLGARHEQSKRLVASYHAHVLAGRERHFRYRGSYYAYDHWVPQFAVYAITD
jgi:hypothetical protein